MEGQSTAHLDVRELAQVRVHGQQRLVHQLLVVIHPEQVIVLQKARAQEWTLGGLGCSRASSPFPETQGPAPLLHSWAAPENLRLVVVVVVV